MFSPTSRKIENGPVLKHVGHSLAYFQELPFRHAPHILSSEVDAAVVRLEESCNQLEQDTLASSALSQDSHRLAPFDLQ